MSLNNTLVIPEVSEPVLSLPKEAIWYPFTIYENGTMDTRLGNMLLHCSTTYIHVSIREYDGVDFTAING